MAVRYTDVDLMLLNRWDEVAALQDAFDELLRRMGGVIEGVLSQASQLLSDRGFVPETDVKNATLSFWKRDWENRRKDAAIYFHICDFAPNKYARNIDDHPAVLLNTTDFATLRVQESAEQFGRVLRSALSAEQLSRWSHIGMDLADAPIGRDYTDVTDGQRVTLAADPQALYGFLVARVDDCAEVIPAIDATLARMTRK